MSLSFQSLAALPVTGTVADDAVVLVKTSSGYQNAAGSTLKTYFIQDLETRVTSLESGGGTGIWPTPRTISLGGVATGAVEIDGSTDVTLNVSIGNGALTTAMVNGLDTQLSGINAAIAGKLGATATAVAATKLATPRAITLTGDVTGTVNFDGTAAASITTTASGKVDKSSHYGATGQSWDSQTTTGFYRDDGAASGSNRPGTAYGQMIVSGSMDSVLQLYGNYTGDHYYLRAASNPAGTPSWSSWVELWHSGNFTPSNYLPLSGGGTINGNITMAGDILPDQDNVRSLGSPTLMWKDVYVGPGSLYINGQKVIGDSGTGDIRITADPGQNLAVWTYGTGDIELAPQGSGVIQIKGPLQINSAMNILSSDGNSIHFGNSITFTAGQGITNGLLIDGNTAWHAGNLTAASMLTMLKTVDGIGSGLDADLLDGQTGSYYLSLANATGTLATTAMGSGANTASNFLRGDGTWSSQLTGGHFGVSGNYSAGFWGTGGVGFVLGGNSYTDNSSAGSVATDVAIHAIGQPTLLASNVTAYTGNVATLSISGAPISTGNASITGSVWALHVRSGNSYFGGSIVSGVATGTAPMTVNSTTVVANLNADLLDGQHGSYYTNAANLTGTVAVARLGSGTANNTTFLRGDGTWAAPSASVMSISDTRSVYPLPLASGYAKSEVFDLKTNAVLNRSGSYLSLPGTNSVTQTITPWSDATNGYIHQLAYNGSGALYHRYSQQNSSIVSNWAASTAYALNASVNPSPANGFIYVATTAGTSAAAQPTWPTTAGATVTDGTVVWTAVWYWNDWNQVIESNGTLPNGVTLTNWASGAWIASGAGGGTVTIGSTAVNPNLLALVNGTPGAGTAKLVVDYNGYFNNQVAGNSSSASFQIAGGGFTQAMAFFPNMSAGSYNPLVATGDQAIIYGMNAQNAGALTIAPWGTPANGSYGLRMDAKGAVNLGSAYGYLGGTASAAWTAASSYGLYFGNNMEYSTGAWKSQNTAQQPGLLGLSAGQLRYYSAATPASAGAAVTPNLVFTIDPNGNTTASSYANTTTYVTPAPNSNAAAAAFRANGSYGGGYGLVDGAYGISMYSISGALNFGFGSNTALNASAAEINSGGQFTSKGSSAYKFRMVHGNYGAMWYSDGGNMYLLLTNSGDQMGGFNGLRPFYVSLASGGVSMNQGASVTNGLTVDYQNVTGRLWCGWDSGTTGAISCSNWFRSSGQTGIFFNDYGGGWYMTDTTYVRAYNGKAVAAADFVISSDKTLKTAVRDLEYKGRLHPVNFHWKATGKADIGFIAQEVQKLYPQAVDLNPHTGKLQLSLQKMTAVLSHQVNMVEDEYLLLRDEHDELVVQHAKTVERLEAVESDLTSAREEVSSLRDEVAELRELVKQLLAKKA